MTEEQHPRDGMQQEPWVALRDEPDSNSPLNSGSPVVPRDWRRVLRFVLIGIAIVIASFSAYLVFFAGGRDTGPTLEYRLNTQQQALDQLHARIDKMQSGQDGVSSHLTEVALRLEGLTASRQWVPDQLDALSNRLDDFSHSVDTRLSVAQEKMQSFEVSLNEMRLSSSNQKPATQSSPKPRRQIPHLRVSAPKLPTPPFIVSGIEIRGGRTYLSLISGQAGQLSDLRLISEGQRIGAWQLMSIDGQSATFTVEGQTVVVPVP